MTARRIPIDFAHTQRDEDQRRHVVSETLAGCIAMAVGMFWLFWLAGGV